MIRCRLERLHSDGNVFLVDGSGSDWATWRVQFSQLWSPLADRTTNFFHDYCVALLDGSESLAAAFASFVPSSVAEESFWCRYLYARRLILPHELAVFILENEATTFSLEPNDVDFASWKEVFLNDWEKEDGDVATDCEVALEKSQLLSWQYRHLVPANVSARDFWCRYLYRRAILMQRLSTVEHDQSIAISETPAQGLHDAHSAEITSAATEPNAMNSSEDGVACSPSQIATSTSCHDTSLPGDVMSPAEPLAQLDVHQSHSTHDSKPSSPSADSENQDVSSSGQVSSRVHSSLEEDGWDEWE